jgi:hypothetical protein
MPPVPTQEGVVVAVPQAPQLRAARQAIDAAVSHLPADVLRRSARGRWSAADILEHLTLAFRLNAAALEKALASGELRARPPRLAQTLLRTLVTDMGYFPRAEAPAATQPSGSIAAEDSIAAIQEALTALDDALTRAAARFGDDVAVVNHPYFSGMSVRQWRRFHWRHTVHHMRQVRARTS